VNYFTPAEDQFLKDNYLTIPAKRMSVLLGRSESGARQRMAILGIVVPREVIEQFKKDSHFKAGLIPFNKGRKQVEYMSTANIERTKLTRFVAGQLPTNHKPVGSERKCIKDGYIMIKVKEPNIWRLKQRVIWEDHYKQKLTAKQNVWFKDKNIYNFDISNLEVVTKEESVTRNSVHRYSPEVKHSFRLIKKLKKAINEKQNN
jgi:hypothetical protein